MTPNKNLSVPKNEQSKEHELNHIGKRKEKKEGEITKQNQFKNWLKTKKKLAIKRIGTKFKDKKL